MFNKMKTVTSKMKSVQLKACQKLSASKLCPTEKQAQAGLFVLGMTLLVLGLSADSQAWDGTTKYNDARIVNAVNAVLSYLEGTFGALVMAAAGIGAILSAAFGQYKAALSLMVVAVGAFILRSLMSTFFNDEQVQPS